VLILGQLQNYQWRLRKQSPVTSCCQQSPVLSTTADICKWTITGLY